MRRLPLVCLIISVFRMITGRLVLSKRFLNSYIQAEDGKEYQVFRHIELKAEKETGSGCILLVSFKFAHLSHKVNKLTSIIPMLVIAGTPGFISKIYAVDRKEGYWRGMYQWRSVEQRREYKKSFVFRMMVRRSVSGSLSMEEIDNASLIDYIGKHKLKENNESNNI